MKKEVTITAISICALTIALVGYVAEAEAAVFAKYDGIDGEAKDSNHDKWIDVLSIDYSITRDTSSTTARSIGAPIFSDIVVTKELDKASPKLAEAISTGKVIPKVEIHLTDGRQTYYAYELTNVMITSYSVSGDADDRPTEEVAFNFEQIRTTYTEYGSDGTKKGNVEYSWKVEEGAS